MQHQLAGRKRPAPGAPSFAQTTADAGADMAVSDSANPSNLTNDEFLAWTGNENISSGAAPPNFDGAINFETSIAQPGQDTSQMSNQLVRRNQNQQVAASGGPYQSTDTDQWSEFENTTGSVWRGDNGQLAEKAAAAKRDALSKRPPKQIPPFIQKLSSFLDNNSNEDLIRWSLSGDSFIVLDEEHFANKLIPELFKHNNYASFVRQLNMYGFHKKVGLTDNSMRASERKAKTPSEYENPYFKRGRPDLLWLITKPRPPGGKSKKKGRGEEDSEEEEYPDDQQPDFSQPGNKKLDLVTLPRSQLATFQSEIQQLKRQQQQINAMIARFQHENTQYIRQASAQHERHENSINAILQFLATFYSRNADGSGNIPNMFAGGNLTNNQPSGNVQEVNDYDEDQEQTSNTARRQPKRPLALLPAPTITKEDRSVTPEAASAASRPISASEQQALRPQSTSQPSKRHIRTQNSSIRDSVDTNSPAARSTPDSEFTNPTTANTPVDTQPTQLNIQQEPPPKSQQSNDSNLQRTNSEIMHLINKSNAASPNMNLDFSSALKNYENASPHGPLTPEQRNNVLSLMASNSGAEASLNNALTNTTGPGSTKSYIDQFTANQEELEKLQRLQKEQQSRVQNLAGRLQPLSPHGSIPGLETFDGTNNPSGLNFSPEEMDNVPFNLDGTDDAGAADSLDINNWLNPDFVDDGGVAGAGGHMEFPPAAAGAGAFNFDNASDNYFGNVGLDGSTLPTVSGADEPESRQQLGGDVLNMTTGNDSMFALDGLDDADATNGGLRPEMAEGDDDDEEGGKVIGSVGTSSAGRSPAVEDYDGDEDRVERGKKRRRFA